MSEGAFVDALIQGQSVAPLYFAFAADANRRGHALLDDHEPVPGLAWPAVAAAQRAGAVLIDGRIPRVFTSGHVRWIDQREPGWPICRICRRRRPT